MTWQPKEWIWAEWEDFNARIYPSPEYTIFSGLTSQWIKGFLQDLPSIYSIMYVSIQSWTMKAQGHEKQFRGCKSHRRASMVTNSQLTHEETLHCTSKKTHSALYRQGMVLLIHCILTLHHMHSVGWICLVLNLRHWTLGCWTLEKSKERTSTGGAGEDLWIWWSPEIPLVPAVWQLCDSEYGLLAHRQKLNKWQWLWLQNSSSLIATRAPANLAETLLAQITALLMKSEPSPLLAPHGKTSVLSREWISP